MKQLRTKELPIKDHYLIVGSYPLNIRPVKDIDVICYENQIQVECEGDDYIKSFIYEGVRVECLLADCQESLQEFLDYYGETTYELLYILKKGHIINPLRDWTKHMNDLNWLKHMVNQEDRFINLMIQKHRKTTEERCKLRTPKLKGVSKQDFFDDYVEKPFEHDYIHSLVAHLDKPMYSFCQDDKVDTVYCEKDKWNKLSHQHKLWMVAEECYVIAMERFMITQIMSGKIPKHPKIAFIDALQKVCTTLCSGWFREFAIDNYFDIISVFDENKIKKTLEILKLNEKN